MNDIGIFKHLFRMRFALGFALTINLTLGIASFILPTGRPSAVEPVFITLFALVAGLWLGGTAGRDATRRLDYVKRAFAATGDMKKLLTNHFVVYLIILGRLLCIALAGIGSAGWGLGPRLSLPFFILAAVMLLLTWPSYEKTRLLIDRAAAMRP